MPNPTDPITQFEMLKAVMCDWPESHVAHMDRKTDDGNILRTVHVRGEDCMIAMCLISPDSRLLKLIYPEFKLQ